MTVQEIPLPSGFKVWEEDGRLVFWYSSPRAQIWSKLVEPIDIGDMNPVQARRKFGFVWERMQEAVKR